MEVNTRRAFAVCKLLGARAPARIAGQYWRMLQNGWCTARRFQAKPSQCVFGCSGEDSLEHYCRCNVVTKFLCSTHPSGPGLPTEMASPEAFFLVRRGLEEQLILKLAVALHAIFRACHAHVRGTRPYARPLKMLRCYYHSSDRF